jgi:hypothetical protein
MVFEVNPGDLEMNDSSGPLVADGAPASAGTAEAG